MEPEDTCSRTQKSNALSVADSIKSHAADGDHSLFSLKDKTANVVHVRKTHHKGIRTTYKPAWRKSFTTSSQRSTSPSTPPPMRKPNRDVAKALAAAHAKMEAQLQSPGLLHAASRHWCHRSGFGSGEESQKQLRFTGPPSPNFAGQDDHADSGAWSKQLRIRVFLLHVLHLPERLHLCWRLLVWPNRHNGGDTPKWCPPRVVRRQKGKPSATISNRRPSRGLGTARSMSLTFSLVVI